MLEVRNLGGWDRTVRVVMGSGLLALVGKADKFDPWRFGGAVAGTALLITGLVGSCMFYSLLGLPTPKPTRCSR
jgi:hypothetical protein